MVPISNVIEPWLSRLNLSHDGWRLAHVAAYGILVMLNATKWFIMLWLRANGRVKLAVVLGLFFAALLLLSVSLRNLPL